MSKAFKIGDKVRTPDGKVITVQGIIAGPFYRSVDCQPADHPHKLNDGAAATEGMNAAKTVVWGNSSGDSIMWGT